MAVAQPAYWVDGRRDDGLGSDAESVGVKLLAELRGVEGVAAARFEVNQHRLRNRTLPEVCTAFAVVGVVHVRRHVGRRLARDDQNEEAVSVKLTAVFAEQDDRASWKITKVSGTAIRVDNRLALVTHLPSLALIEAGDDERVWEAGEDWGRLEYALRFGSVDESSGGV